MNDLWRIYLCSDTEDEFWVEFSDDKPPSHAMRQSIRDFIVREDAVAFCYQHDPEIDHEYYEDTP